MRFCKYRVHVGAEDEAKCPTCNYQHRTGAAITAINTVGDD